MKKLLCLSIVLLATSTVSYGQENINDSIKVLYKKYFDLIKVKEKVSDLDLQLGAIETKHTDFNELIQSNNERIAKITDKQLFSQKIRVIQRRNKIVNTSAFVSTANVSLNAIKLLDAVTSYLNDIAALNSPENEELGFSLSTEMEKVLKDQIIKGRKKINKGNTTKFIAIVKEIIKSPISDVISSALPVVGSIKSVIDLVIGTALRGNDVSVKEVAAFKVALKSYLEHYQGLAIAQNDFKQNLNSVNVRKEALQLLLYKYTTERIVTLTPSASTSVKGLSLTQLINKEYQERNVLQKVDQIIDQGNTNYADLLLNPKIGYPYYAVNQAKLIRDEIESLGKEYITIYNSYQNSVSNVLTKSKKIGNPAKIDHKIETLNNKLQAVNKDFEDALNFENLNSKFKKLTEY